ncbi:MAG: hypothetical protein QM602_07725 [Microbacterium sp.]
MSSTPPPRRRHSPAVYRRRRLVVLLALVAIVVAVWLLIARPWSGAATEGSAAEPAASALPKQTATALPVPAAATASPTPTATPTSAGTPTPTPSSSAQAAGKACAAADLLVEPITDKDSYSAKQKPKLSIALTNTGDEDCTLNVGTSTQKFTIASGSEVYWRSTDCQTTPSDQVVLLAAGQRVVSATPLVWDRTRSSVDSCEDSSRSKAPGDGASYHLTVEIGGVESDGSKQFLLY